MTLLNSELTLESPHLHASFSVFHQFQWIHWTYSHFNVPKIRMHILWYVMVELAAFLLFLVELKITVCFTKDCI